MRTAATLTAGATETKEGTKLTLSMYCPGCETYPASEPAKQYDERGWPSYISARALPSKWEASGQKYNGRPTRCTYAPKDNLAAARLRKQDRLNLARNAARFRFALAICSLVGALHRCAPGSRR